MNPSVARSSLAIARVTMVTLLRSRLVAWVAVGLVAGLLLLQALVRGDGTVEGRFRLTVLYSLHFTAAWLGLATLWIASASLAQEIGARSIQMVVVKPVRRGSLWIGKWLGLATIQAGWLLLAGLVVAVGARWSLRRAVGSAQPEGEAVHELLTVRHVVEAEGPDLQAEAKRQLRQIVAERKLPQGVSLRAIQAKYLASLQARRWTVPPAGTQTWTFVLPPRLPSETGGEVIYRLSGAARYREPVTGTWTVRMEGRQVATVPVSEQTGDRYRFAFAAVDPGPSRRVQVTFHNAGTSAVILDPRGGVQMAVKRGTWEGNLLRALGILFCRMALLAAVGLTAGACFSLPVAVFFTAGLLSVATLSHTLASGALPAGPHTHEGHHAERGLWDWTRIERMGTHLGETLDRVLAPLRGIDAAGRVGEGYRVTNDLLGRAVLWWLAVYPAVLGGLGAGILAVRELGLPEASGP